MNRRGLEVWASHIRIQMGLGTVGLGFLGLASPDRGAAERHDLIEHVEDSINL